MSREMIPTKASVAKAHMEADNPVAAPATPTIPQNTATPITRDRTTISTFFHHDILPVYHQML